MGGRARVGRVAAPTRRPAASRHRAPQRLRARRAGMGQAGGPDRALVRALVARGRPRHARRRRVDALPRCRRGRAAACRRDRRADRGDARRAAPTLRLRPPLPRDPQRRVAAARRCRAPRAARARRRAPLGRGQGARHARRGRRRPALAGRGRGRRRHPRGTTRAAARAAGSRGPARAHGPRGDLRPSGALRAVRPVGAGSGPRRLRARAGRHRLAARAVGGCRGVRHPRRRQRAAHHAPMAHGRRRRARAEAYLKLYSQLCGRRAASA